MSTWFRRVWHLLNRSRHERELVREMNEHRETMPDPSKFGDTHRLLEYSRDAWGWNWLDDAAQDFRLGMRALKRSPVFAITAILILSFGIGLNLTVFQMAQVVLLRGPSVPRPDTLARLHRHGKAARSNSEAVPYVAAMAVAREQTLLSADGRVHGAGRVGRRLVGHRGVVRLGELVCGTWLWPNAGSSLHARARWR